jgi:hypothetical protein
VSNNLDLFTAPDAYSEAVGFLRCQDAVKVRISVNNQAVYWRRGHGLVGGSVGDWEAEDYLPPGLFSLAEACDAVQVRAAVPAATLAAKEAETGKEVPQAKVAVQTRTAGES